MTYQTTPVCRWTGISSAMKPPSACMVAWQSPVRLLILLDNKSHADWRHSRPRCSRTFTRYRTHPFNQLLEGL
ncbi:hypothetical protein BDQ94DRAFT_143478 [Aspergillus welwitschiae]|uniref:Uncharacterized protein n=1 Tax=Aspergillus welwitschiae TaxID=1341132 RepID=A0A3F3Q379_9EURO|nr:hypothetical protein BDQ94DRAFT_143478 [Aspergillus welwitschiae]RDH33633.1 hypothetical protein BDQ94DRAFT_143478 [Aspergillus welwitschiae]